MSKKKAENQKKVNNHKKVKKLKKVKIKKILIIQIYKNLINLKLGRCRSLEEFAGADRI